MAPSRGHRVARSLGVQVFASESHAPRARRAVDVVTLVVGVLLLVALAAVADDRFALEESWQQLVEALPGWLQWLSEVTYFLAGLYLVVLVVGVGLVARQRKDLLRDLLVAVVLSVGLVVVLSRLVSGDWPDVVFLDLSDTATTYPALFLTVLTAVQVTAAPHLSRPVRRLGWWIVLAPAVAALLANLTQVRDTVAALIAGVTVGAAVHLLFGSPAGRPSLGRVTSALTELGVRTTGLSFDARQEESATMLTATGPAGEPLQVAVYGRDAARSQRISRAWRVAWYRDPPEPTGASRLQLDEHAALCLLLAAQGGVGVPEVVAVGTAGAGDALLVTSSPGRPLADLEPTDLDDALLAEAWAQLGALHDAGVSHGRPDLEHLYLSGEGRIRLSGFDVAQVSPTDGVVHADRAELLAATALAVGDERAVTAAHEALGDERLVEVLPSLQSAGLSPGLRSRVRHGHLSLKQLRHEAAERAGTDVPEMEKLHRVSAGQVLMTAITVFAVYAIITSLADIGLDTIGDALAGASWGLVLVALALTQLTNVGNAVAVLGASPKPLPFGVVTVEQFAIGFINVAVPSSAARVAMNMRFGQRVGLSSVAAATLGGLTSVGGFAVQLVLLFLLVVPGDNSVDWSSFQLGGSVFKLLALAAVIAVGSGLVVMLAPGLRARAVDRFREPARQVRTGVGPLRSPRQLVQLLGGNLAAQLLFAAALGLCVRAVGGSVGFGELVFINTVVSLFAGLAPVPGGIGVTEAGLIAGLTGVGVPDETAVAAIIVYRMCSYYLPPIWGWYATRWLTGNDYL